MGYGGAKSIFPGTMDSRTENENGVGVKDQAAIETLLSGYAERLSAEELEGAGSRLNEVEVYALLKQAGIATCGHHFLARGKDSQAQLDWARRALELGSGQGKLLLKAVGRNILHKTEAAGIRVVTLAGGDENFLLGEVAALLKAVAQRGHSEQLEGVVAAAFVPHRANQPGQEVLLSLKQDPAFGPVVVLGIGGTLTEWYGKAQGKINDGPTSTVIFPAVGLKQETVAEVLQAHPLLSLFCTPSRLYPVPPFALAELVQAVTALAELGLRWGPAGVGAWTLEEIEINPAVAASGSGLTALDGVGLLSRRKWGRVGRPLQKIDSLLRPRSAVVMGASAKAANPGRIILENLRRSEGIEPGRLFVVHQRESEIAGVPCYKDVKGLPEKCDLAVVSIPAEGALAAIHELVTCDKAQSIILIPGGFAEAGQTELAAKIEETLAQGHDWPGGGPVMVGGNCLGIVSRDQYNTFFLPEYKLPFRPGLGQNLAMVSQSGAYLVTFASNYDGVIFPAASISFGNQMDLTVADFLDYFNGQPHIQVIACYVEGFRPGDGARFLEFAEVAKKAGKRVIMYKAGKTALGAKAAASHTASLAGDYAVARSCLTAAGVQVAESLDEFEDLIKTFTLLAGKPVGAGRTGIISNAGFECSTVMDSLNGLTLAEFDEQTQGRLDEALPPFAHRQNPIDATPMTATDAFAASCRAILDSDSVDVAILSSVPVTPALDNLPADPQGRHPDNLAGPRSQASQMLEILASSAKPAVVVIDSGGIYDPMCRMIESAGVPVFRKIDRAARALAAFCRSR